MLYRELRFLSQYVPWDFHSSIKMYSPSLSRVIDEYYNYEEGNMWTSTHDTIYTGNLIEEKFKMKKEKLSFILGAYLRYGQNNEESHTIFKRLKIENVIAQDKIFSDEIQAVFLTNAPAKARLCATLLEELACKRVEYYMRNSVPSGFLCFLVLQKR